jgi:hypothetical protein
MPLGPGEDQWIVQHTGAIVQRLDCLHVLGSDQLATIIQTSNAPGAQPAGATT